MENDMESSSNSNIAKIAFFWIGVILLIFAGIVNVALIILAIYPFIIGIIVSIWVGEIGLLSLIYALKWDYEMSVASHISLSIIYLAMMGFIALSTVLMVLAYITIVTGIVILIIGIGFLITLSIIHLSSEVEYEELDKRIIVLIAIVGIPFVIGFIVWFIDLTHPLLDIILLGIAFAITLISLVIDEQTDGSTIKYDMIRDDIGKRGLQILMVIGLFVAGFIMFGIGLLQVMMEITPELTTLGWVLTYLGLAWIGGTAGLTIVLLVKSLFAKNDMSSKLKFLLLGIGIGVGIGILSGYLIVLYVL